MASQFGQDIFVWNKFFHGKGGLVFVDIGAHDGKDLSNTLIFEEQFDWTGWCFEPNPTVFEKLQKNRPKSICVDAAIAAVDGFLKFTVLDGYSEMLSGVNKNYNREHVNRIRNELHQQGGTAREIDVYGSRLKNIVPATTHINYLSIDTEGGEHDILEDILCDFNVDVITVEINYENDRKKIAELMEKNEYDLVKTFDVDHVYAKRGKF